MEVLTGIREVSISLLQGTVTQDLDDTRYTLLRLPLGQFKWLIYISAGAMHMIIAVIISELMSRSYRKWLLWFLVAFCFPIVGPISILWYHHIAAKAVSELRKESFWERLLFSNPVSLYKNFMKQQAVAQEATLHNPRPFSSGRSSFKRDAEIEALIVHERFDSARAHAWKMMEIARESSDADQIERYQEYLEIIAEKESLTSGSDLNANRS